MRIAQVAFRFDAPGGVETNVRAVAGGLAQIGENVDVFASDVYDESRWERRNDFAPTVERVAVHRFPAYRQLVPGLTLPMLPGLMTALSGFSPDVIHAHSHRYGHVLEAAVVARNRRIPLVVSLHYHPADRREPAVKRGLLRLQDFGFGATAYRIARALVVETEQEARRVREFAPADRIHIIPPGIDLDQWDRARRESYPGLPSQYILYAGRVASNKGLPVLLRAHAGLPSEERIPLVIVGRDWGERSALEALARELGVSGSVLWLGHVNDPTSYRQIFFGATLFALPSEYEAFGLVLLEAMAAGLPIVASAVGGVPEVLDGGRVGRLVPYGDVSQWTTALSEMLADRPQTLTLAQHGREKVRGLTWTHAVERHLALYRAVLAASGRRGGFRDGP